MDGHDRVGLGHAGLVIYHFLLEARKKNDGQLVVGRGSSRTLRCEGSGQSPAHLGSLGQESSSRIASPWTADTLEGYMALKAPTAC